LRAAWVVQAPVGAGGDAGQVRAAGAVLDDDQGIHPPQQDRVDVHEVGGQDAAGLGGQELLPGLSCPAGGRVESGVVEDLPDRGGRDAMAEPDHLALDASVSPGGIVGGDADHELADPGGCHRPSGAPAAGVVPFPSDEAAVPAKDSAGRDQPVRQEPSGQEPDQHGEDDAATLARCGSSQAGQTSGTPQGPLEAWKP
jgi:hypothetical protein